MRLRRAQVTPPGRSPGDEGHDPLRRVIDPDVDLHDAAQRAETRPHEWDLLLAVAAGGVAGAEGRYGLGVLLPSSGAQFPWSTLIVNVSGCLLIGVLMAVLELMPTHRLARPFLGVGLLGGYTTFSTFALDAERLVRNHEPWRALGYAAATLVLCLSAVALATRVTRVAGRTGTAAEKWRVPGATR